MICPKTILRPFSRVLLLTFSTAFLFFSACDEQKKEDQDPPTEQPEKAGISPSGQAAPKFRATVDQLRVRSKPDLNAEVVGAVHEGETVTYLGEDSPNEIEVNLRGKKVKAPFKKVMLNDGTEGWIFGGGIAPASSSLSAPTSSADPAQFQKYLETLEKKSSESLKTAAEELKKRFSADPQAADQAIAEYIMWSRMALDAINDEFLNRKDLNEFELILWNPDKKPIPQKVEDFSAKIQSHGLGYIFPEGMLMLDFKPGWWEEQFSGVGSPAMQQYLAQISLEQKEGYGEDAGLVITPLQLAKRVVFWEKFREEHPNFPMSKEIQIMHQDYAWTLVSGLDNTPYVTFDKGNPVDPAFKKAYEWVIAEAPDGMSKTYIKGWYQLLKERDFKAGKEPWSLSSDYIQKHGQDF